MATREDRKAQTALGALVGGGTLTALAPSAPRAANAVRRGAITVAMNRRAGRLGGLTPEGAPVDPLSLSGRRRGSAGANRRPSSRAAARTRFAAARAPYQARLARGLGTRTAVGLMAGQAATGIGSAALGARYLARHNDNAVGKAADYFTDPALSPMNLVGIPPQRAQPVDPLQMQAASSIMAGVLVGASGRRLTRRERKAIRSGAYRFVGAQHMVVTPTGFRGLVTS